MVLNNHKENYDSGSPDWGESKNWVYKKLKVHFKVTGDQSNPPIVLIHGFGASSEHWRHNAEVFASEGYRVFGIDLIGFGKSDQGGQENIKNLNNNFWASQLASFLEEVVDTRQNGKAILIGNSLGALVALTTLSNNKELIKAIIAAPLPEPIFINPIKLATPDWFKKVKRFTIKLLFNLFPLKALINLIARTKLITFALQSAYFRPIQKDNLLRRIVTVPAKRPNASKALRAMCIGMSNRLISETGPSIISRIKLLTNRPPILLIWGTQDKLIPLFLAQKLIKLHPWLKLTIIDNVGHCPHDELPKQFNQIVLKWLKT
tara:strand:+ start:138 stop:1094 length:957 start_codon:yes stop_codon:yes gene_type:complete